ncbi:hypothetical protein ACIBM3_30410 [Rhodococcus erythropolis]|uniref:hypothetical protein n=1 Tax=Rhodococcus erythropolis TaxID=1833 RepID=UPI003793766B
MNTKFEQWSAHARTPETRTRIRRLAVLERIFHVLGVVGVYAFVVMLAISWYINISGESPWWIWFLDIGVLLASIFPYFVTLARLETAMYADGEESVGTITSVVLDPHNVSDSEASYDIAITAEHAQAGRIRRRTSVSTKPRRGDRVRFRHNTRKPDDLHDILYIGLEDNDPDARS